MLAGCGAASADNAAFAVRSAPNDQLKIGLTEWSIETGPVQAAASDVTLRVTNTGGTRHDLMIHGSEGSWATPLLDPAETYGLSSLPLLANNWNCPAP